MNKRFLLLPFLMAVLIFVVSCKKNGTTNPTVETPNPSLTASSDSLAFAIAGGSSALNVTMNGGRWAAASDQSWCTLSANSSTGIPQGIKPFFWDTGTILGRRSNTVIDQETIDAIMAGAK